MKTCTITGTLPYPKGCKGKRFFGEEQCTGCPFYGHRMPEPAPKERPLSQGWTAPAFRLSELSEADRKDPLLHVL